MANLKAWKFKLLQLSGTTTSTSESKPTTTQIFLNQVLDSAIVAGISAITAFAVAGPGSTLTGAAIGFSLTFLVKMKEYRGLKA